MCEDLGFDSGFDDVGSADFDVDSGFDDTSFDTDYSVDDIGGDDILGDDLGETDLSLDVSDDFVGFDDMEDVEPDFDPVEDDFLTDVEDEIDLSDEEIPADELSDDGDIPEFDDFDETDLTEIEDTSSVTDWDGEDLEDPDVDIDVDIDTDGLEDISESDEVTDETPEEDVLDTEQDDTGFFEDIPDEAEPFVMEEATAETDVASEDPVPEFEEDFEEGEESIPEAETSGLELSDDGIETEEASFETDGEIDSDETAGELTDAPEDEKTPYEALRDYMYEHNYGQMDYPEYSQDPEWQALNEQFTASLDETPAAADPADAGFEQTDTETPQVDIAENVPVETEEPVSEDTVDTDVPQELHDGDVIEIQHDVNDDASDTFEIPEEALNEVPSEADDPSLSEGEKTPYEALRDYMYEHNYGQLDYPEYSQDPEWQALNEQFTASLDETPAAADPADAGFEQTDTETPQVDIAEDVPVETEEPVSEDTVDTDVPQELHDGDAVYFHESEPASFDVASPETEDYCEDNPDVSEPDSGVELSEVSDGTEDSLSDWEADTQIDLHDDELTDEQADAVTEDFDIPSEGDDPVPDVTEGEDDMESSFTDVPEQLDDAEESFDSAQTEDYADITDSNDTADLFEEFDNYEIPGSLTDFETAEVSDLPDDASAGPPYVREYDDFETLQLIENPEFYETGQFYEQGINEYGFEGTCGPTSQANAVNTLLGNNELTENKVLEIAVDNQLCDVSDDVWSSGGTTTENFMRLYDKVNESIGDKLDTEVFEYDNALTVSEMADKLDEGSVLNIAVDSATLWGENDHIPGVLAEDAYTDHWITVTGVDRTDTGDITGFNIIDSGGGESYVDADTYERMCFGEEGREMIDPTCIVVSKKQEI